MSRSIWLTNRHIVLIGVASAAIAWPITSFAQNQVIWANPSDNLAVPSGGGTAALLDQADIFTGPMTLRPGGHAKGLGIMKTFPTNSTPAEPALQIEDAPNSPDTSGYLLRVLANNTGPKGRPVFQITREGGVQVWDWFAIAPTKNGAHDWLGRTQAMCFVGSDLADPEIATTMLLSNGGGHHDLLRMHDIVYSRDVNNPGSVRRFTFTGPGSLIFGNKTNNAVPALKPQGSILAVKNGTDSDYADIVTRKAGIGTGLAAPNSTLQVNGSVAAAVTTVTSSYNLTDKEFAVLCDAAAGPITLTLPSAASTAGREYKIKRIDLSSNAVTLAAAGGSKIDGGPGYSLVAQYATICVISDGKNWWVF